MINPLLQFVILLPLIFRPSPVSMNPAPGVHPSGTAIQSLITAPGCVCAWMVYTVDREYQAPYQHHSECVDGQAGPFAYFYSPVIVSDMQVWVWYEDGSFQIFKAPGEWEIRE